MSNQLDESVEEPEPHICHQCIRDEFLSSQVARTGKTIECDYCLEVEPSWSIDTLADAVEVAFRDHYVRTSDQPNMWQEGLLRDRESDYFWVRDGQPVLEAIQDAASIPRQAAEDVLDVLSDRHEDFDLACMGEESEFARDSHYEEVAASAAQWAREWRTFEHSLKTEARFFSKGAAEHLASVFGGVDRIRTRKSRRLVVQAGPKRQLRYLFRARVFQSQEKLEEALCRPDSSLGPPPSALAAAGRMNARGISVFYGATKEDAAIAEVRPPVGSNVAVARFEIVRPLHLLDLTALEHAIDFGSVFDPTLKGRLERIAFLRTLGQLLTRPVMPDDEGFDYLATQAVADFLATHNEPVLDGIIFASAQIKGGRNVVLFRKAARVKNLVFPKGTELGADSYIDTDDGRETNYTVRELVAASEPLQQVEDDFDPGSFATWSVDSSTLDERQPALRVDPDSVRVHAIQGVKFRAEAHGVTRFRMQRATGKEDF